MRRSPLATVLVLVVLLAAFWIAPTAVRAQGSDPYSARSLTDHDFLLYFQYMELIRQQVDAEALASFARQNNLTPEALNSLVNRVNLGRLIIENPGMAESMVATYGPIINPTDQERALFEKYADDISRLLSLD